MSKFTDFPRNTKQAHIKSCAQAAKEAAIRAQQIEDSYREHVTGQNAWLVSDEVVTPPSRVAAELGIDISRRVAA